MVIELPGIAATGLGDERIAAGPIIAAPRKTIGRGHPAFTATMG